MNNFSGKMIDGVRLNRFAKKFNLKIQADINVVKDMLGGRSLRYVTQEEYDALSDIEKNNDLIVWNIIDADIIQVDWNETDATSPAFILNKPTIPTLEQLLPKEKLDQFEIAYLHSQTAHAPANAQKNSDITKAEIEAKLTGDITSHTHSEITNKIVELENNVMPEESDVTALINSIYNK